MSRFLQVAWICCTPSMPWFGLVLRRTAIELPVAMILLSRSRLMISISSAWTSAVIQSRISSPRPRSPSKVSGIPSCRNTSWGKLSRKTSKLLCIEMLLKISFFINYMIVFWVSVSKVFFFMSQLLKKFNFLANICYFPLWVHFIFCGKAWILYPKREKNI